MKLRHLLIPALAVAGAAYLLAPEKPDAEKTAPFRGRNFAHRGLHTKDGSAPENSLPAFQAASILGFGVELDVHLTADNKVVVFHDDTLERMCGDPRKIEDLTFEELSEFIEYAKFDRLGVFAYSQEEDTPAAEFADQIG